MGISVYAENEYIKLFEALSSKTRLNIIRLLAERELNIKQISEKLGLSPAIVTRHINMLEKCGIVFCKLKPSSRGRQKVCYLREESIRVFLKSSEYLKKQSFILRIGDYEKYIDLQPPCGLEDGNGVKGIKNDPRYFMIPDRKDLKCLWFSNGVLKYLSPVEINGTKINSLRAKLFISVGSNNQIYDFGEIYFGFCEKICCRCNIPVSDEPVEIQLEFDTDGVRLNGEIVSDCGINNYDFDLQNFSFELGAGYYKGNKTVVTAYALPDFKGIEIEVTAN